MTTTTTITATTTPTTTAKENGVTTLTFRGHVTSLVTWPLDSWSTSYGWSIATMRLSGTVTEIWHLKVHVYTHTRNDGQNDQSLYLL